ncbi:MAG: HlyD family secretion protein [Akkermansiaceae bacterium]|nr:HlyD family secretion protein [Akkermansiaceae bacterium]
MSDSPSAPESTPAAAQPRKRGILSKLVLVPLLIGGGVWGVRFVHLAMTTEETDDAYIAGHVHQISAGVPGPLLKVIADDNQEVKEGELLAKIDPLEFDIMEKKAVAALEQAKARELQATAQAAEARSSGLQAEALIATTEADINQSEAKRDIAKITLDRNESLLQGETHAISKAEVDNARSAYTAAVAAVASTRAKLESARAGKEASCSTIKAAEAQIVAAHADIDALQTAISEAQRQKSFTDVVAPATGRIGAKNAETGNRVQIGQALFAVVEEDYWIFANFKETQLKKMKIGQPVELTIDSLGGKKFTGKVDSFAPATGAQFALLPPDNATGNFTKVVQRVPVKITFDPDSIRGFESALRPGLSTVVRVLVQ